MCGWCRVSRRCSGARGGSSSQHGRRRRHSSPRRRRRWFRGSCKRGDGGACQIDARVQGELIGLAMATNGGRVRVLPPSGSTGSPAVNLLVLLTRRNRGCVDELERSSGVWGGVWRNGLLSGAFYARVARAWPRLARGRHGMGMPCPLGACQRWHGPWGHPLWLR